MFTITSAGSAVQVGSLADLKDIPTSVLLREYNRLTGKQTKKFADRVKGEQQLWKALNDAPKTTPGARIIETVKEATRDIKAGGQGGTVHAPKTKRAPAGDRPFYFLLPLGKEVKAARPGSKRAKALELMRQSKGASFEEIQRECGWERKDAYEGIRLVHYWLGYGLVTVDGRIHATSTAAEHAALRAKTQAAAA
jgi:hypothetical protein